MTKHKEKSVKIPKDLQELFQQRQNLYNDIALEMRHLGESINKLKSIDDSIYVKLLSK